MIKVRHMAQVCREGMATLLGSPSWDDLSDRQRKLSVFIVNFLQVNPDATPVSVHNAWMGEMIHNEGFSLGPADPTARTHPNLVPFEELPEAVRNGYALSIGVVRGLMAIQDRYELCTPQTTVQAEGVLAAADAATPPIVLGALTDAVGNEIAPEETLTPIEKLSNGLTPLVDSAANVPNESSEGFVHFTGKNQLVNGQVETAPESGDVAPATEPASAE